MRQPIPLQRVPQVVKRMLGIAAIANRLLMQSYEGRVIVDKGQPFKPQEHPIRKAN